MGIAFFSLFCLVNLFAQTLTLFLIARFLQGVGCGSVITIGRAIYRDCFQGNELTSANSHLSMGFALGLGLSPIIGGYLQTYFHWQAGFIFLFLLGLALFIVLLKWLPETASRALAESSWQRLVEISLQRYREILSDLIFWEFLLGGVLAYSVVIAYNVMTPFLIQGVLGYSAEAYGWMSLCMAVFYFLAAYMNRSLVLRYHMGKIMGLGLVLIAIPAIALILGAFAAHNSLYVILIPMMVATFGQGLIFSNSISGTMHRYPHIPGKASAMFSSLQMTLAGIISACMSLLPDKSPISLGVLLLILTILSVVFLRREIISSRKHSSK